jgi:hypothetical protein
MSGRRPIRRMLADLSDSVSKLGLETLGDSLKFLDRHTVQLLSADRRLTK